MQIRVLRVVRVAILLAALGGVTEPAFAQARVFSCEPTWAAVAKEVGGDRVEVDSATTARQDVHYIQARPSLIAKLRSADLLVCSGGGLESGWLPLLLRKAANPRVQTGQPGHLDVSQIVPMLDVPSSLDRAEGDIHAYGNPHTETDPRNLGRVAAELSLRLQRIDAGNAEYYQRRGSAFAQRWNAAIDRWQQRGASLRGMRIITHHTSWVYLARWLELEIVAHLEDKPGIPPTAAHLAHLLEEVQAEPVELIVRSVYEPERPSRWLSERSGIPAIVLPHTVGASKAAKDLETLFDDILDRLLTARAP